MRSRVSTSTLRSASVILTGVMVTTLLVSAWAPRAGAQALPPGALPPGLVAPDAGAPAGPPTPPPLGPRQGVETRRVPGDVARRASDGTRALLDGRPADAMQQYDQALVEAPDLAELAYNRGLAALLAGNVEEARQAFELAQGLREGQVEEGRADAAGPEIVEDSRFNDGHAALQADDLAGAVSRWASVVAQDGSAQDARKNLELALRLLQVQEQQQQQQQQQQDQQQEPQDDQQEQPQPQPQPQPQDGEDEQQPQQPQQPEEQEQPQQPEPRPGEMSQEQAEQLLEALEAAEKEAMEDRQEKAARKGKPASGKVW